MKRINLKLLFVTSALFLSTSCTTYIKTNSLKIGMSKEEVQKALAKKPYGIIASKRLPGSNKIMEVLLYQGGQSYWLYFVDGYLDRWEQVNQIGPAI
jgi:hypothetical protein